MNHLLPRKKYIPILIVGKVASIQAPSTGAGSVIDRVPVPIVKPVRIRFHGRAVLVPVPGEVRVGSILDVKDAVPEAGLPKSRVLRLRLCQAAVKSFKTVI